MTFAYSTHAQTAQAFLTLAACFPNLSQPKFTTAAVNSCALHLPTTNGSCSLHSESGIAAVQGRLTWGQLIATVCTCLMQTSMQFFDV